jgi:hypothetical protein
LSKSEEQEVAEEVASGKTQKDVAKRHGVSPRAIGKTARRQRRDADPRDKTDGKNRPTSSKRPQLESTEPGDEESPSIQTLAAQTLVLADGYSFANVHGASDRDGRDFAAAWQRLESAHRIVAGLLKGAR